MQAETRRSRRLARSLAPGALLLLSQVLTASAAPAQTNNPCDQPGEAPDLLAGEIASRTRWGSLAGITAFSLGVAECNTGSCQANWVAETAEHPVIGQNMFRLRNGRFEQIGQSWVMHVFFALSQALCSTGCLATDGSHLGVNCSNTDSAGILGYQPRLGAKFEVNAATGVFPFPATGMIATGDLTFKRLQVHDDDLDPVLNAGAQYWVEVQLVSRDDAVAGNDSNDASWRPVVVTGAGGVFDFTLAGATVRGSPAIEAWRASDPEVTLSQAQAPSDGRFFVGARVTPIPSGYHYEYAVQNLSSHRSAGFFSVPLPPGEVVAEIGFHDVDYHSGEPFSGEDWTAMVTPDGVVWATTPYEQDANANALRWGTLYNFRFDSPLAPGSGQARIGLFRPGSPSEITASTLVPCGGIDGDGDARPSLCDCNDADPLVWSTPGEVQGLVVYDDPSLGPTIGWNAPGVLGGAVAAYDVLRSFLPSDFMSPASCLPSLDPSGLTRADADDPPPGGLFSYLVRARNGCPTGSGTLGAGSNGAPRSGRTCP
jgi:hypothetical protein